jgi:hypothetical protein
VTCPGQLRFPGAPEPEAPKSRRRVRAKRWAPKSTCYLTVADIREMLGYEASPAGYRKAERLMRSAGILVKRGRRSVIAQDMLAVEFPELAMRFTIRETNETLGDLTW